MPRFVAFLETDKKTGGPVPKDRDRKIRCPKCKWQPGRHDRWGCTCGHTWNTFDTRGVCPSCGITWRDTQCLQCNQWSPHEDWYRDDDRRV